MTEVDQQPPVSTSNLRLTDEELDAAIKLASGFDHIPVSLLHIYSALLELKERRAHETFCHEAKVNNEA